MTSTTTAFPFPPPRVKRTRWAEVVLLGCGGLLVCCWWQIRALGDVREHLGRFYGWFAAAFVIYLAALAIVRRAEQARTSSWRALAWVAVIAAACRLIMVGATPTLSDDVYRYRWDGRVQLAGLDPYAAAPDDPSLQRLRDDDFAHINFPHLRTVYPPLAELAFRCGASLGRTVMSQKLVFVAAELMLALSLWSLLWRRGRSPLWIAAYAWHPLAMLEIAGSGHNDSLGMAWLWAGLAAWEARSRLGAAVAWAAAFLSKFLSLALVPWWWFRRAGDGRRWLGLFLGLALLPIALHAHELTALAGSLWAMTTRHSSNASLYLLLAEGCGHARWTPLAAFGIAGAWMAWWARRVADPVRYLFGALMAAALLSPALHPWYVVWLVPFTCFWRVPAMMALTGTAVLAYTVWPGYLAGGPWKIPAWAHVAEYAPVFLLGLWELQRRHNLMCSMGV